MGQLKQWREQQWVRIGTDGKIKGPCGTSENKKNPDRCLPKAKALSLSQAERAKTARKIQILTVLEQRAKAAGKHTQAGIAKRGKEAIRRARKVS